MARRVFFAFHYERDIWRAGQVRNSWLTKPDREEAGFWDAAGWEKVKKEGDEAIKRWIDNQMKGTSVTAVLIGAETSKRRWVGYEVKKSHEEGKGLLGVYIHNIKDDNGKKDTKGDNTFAKSIRMKKVIVFTFGNYILHMTGKMMMVIITLEPG